MPDASEAFLRAFHARHPGATTAAYARGRGPDGRSSYEILRDFVPTGGARVLDLGCGDGHLLELCAADPGRRLIGVDVSSHELAAARRRPALAAALLIHGRAQALPLADASVDACVSHLAFTLMPDVDAIAAELARVIRPGGVFATVVGGGPAADVGGEAFDAFLALAAAAIRTGRAPRLGDPRTRHGAGLDAILGPGGFDPVRLDRVVIDLGGSADQVWTTVASLYELDGLTAATVADLERDFRAMASALARAGRVPCAMAIGVARAARR